MNKKGEVLRDVSNPKLIDKLPFSLSHWSSKKSALNLNVYFYDLVINDQFFKDSQNNKAAVLNYLVANF